MFGQLTVFMPDHVPFTLKVVAVAMTRTNVLILTRLQHEALKKCSTRKSSNTCQQRPRASSRLFSVPRARLAHGFLVARDTFMDKEQLDSWLEFPEKYREEVFEDDDAGDDAGEDDAGDDEEKQDEEDGDDEGDD